jgi:hypothetical protein
MRLSVDVRDLGYQINAFEAKVMIDGVEQKYCITADEELGKVWRHAVDENGKLVICEGEPVVECVNGKVVILVPKDSL